MTSRPVSWPNTAVPFFVGAVLAFGSLHWQIILATIYFCFSYNLLLYGVNDIYDYESDLHNPRKNSLEGGLVSKTKHKTLWYIIIATNVPFLIWLFLSSNFAAQIWLGLTILLCFTYSAKPFRFKEIPVLDSINSSLHFVAPLVFGLLWGHSTNLPWPAIVAFLLWGMASQAFGAIQDIGPDRAGGIRSIATMLGTKTTVAYSLICYVLTCLIVAVAYFPWGILVALFLAIYPLNVSFFKKFRSDAKSLEFRRGWKNFMWLNYIVGFWLAQILLFVFDPFGWGAQKTTVFGGFLIVFALLQLGLTMYNYMKFQRPKTKRLSELPHITILMLATGELDNLSSSLLALVGQNYPNFEVYIADTNASQKAREIVEGYQDKRLHYIDDINVLRGWQESTAAAQTLLGYSETELNVLLQGDTVLLPNTLSVIASLFDDDTLQLSSLLPADQNKSFWQQLIVAQEHYFLLGLYPAAYMTEHYPKLVTAYSPLLAFKKSAIESIGGFKAVRNNPLEALGIANLAHQKGLKTTFYMASDLAVSQNKLGLREIINEMSQRLYPSLRFDVPLSISLLTGGITVLIVPTFLLISLVLAGAYEGTLILALGCLLLLINRGIVMLRSKGSVIGVLLYSVGSAILLACLFNSILRYELHKPRWLSRTEI